MQNIIFNKGGLQDWSYLKTGCLDITIELGCSKYPPASVLAGVWRANRRALVSYLAQVCLLYFMCLFASKITLGYILWPIIMAILGSWLGIIFNPHGKYGHTRICYKSLNCSNAHHSN